MGRGKSTDGDLQERQEGVIAKCEAVQPHHGPIWQAVAKDLSNVGKSTRETLVLVADRVE